MSAMSGSVYFDAPEGEEEEQSDAVSAPRVAAEVVVVAQLQSLSVSLHAERSGEHLALLTMKDMSTNVRMPAAGGMVISVTPGISHNLPRATAPDGSKTI